MGVSALILGGSTVVFISSVVDSSTIKDEAVAVADMLVIGGAVVRSAVVD